MVSPIFSVQLRIKESVRTMEARVMKALGLEIRLRLIQVEGRLASALGRFIRFIIQDTNTWQSVDTGVMRGDLGIPLGTNINSILDAWARSVAISVIGGVNIRADKLFVNISAIPSDYADVLAEAAAEYVSPPSAELIPWLHWLLYRGRDNLVSTHRLFRLTKGNVPGDIFGSLTQKADEIGSSALVRDLIASRTGQAIMRRVTNSRAGFKIRPQHAGTRDDNFVTRAFDQQDTRDLIATIIIQHIAKVQSVTRSIGFQV